MTRSLITGNGAAAWGARLAEVDYVPAFPITPQTEIIETLGAWIDRGEMASKMVTLDSEHSMITAAGAAAATGVRVFTATSSQGLLYGMEMLYTVAGWRAPFVLANVSRGLATPLTLEPDHNDIMAARDSGFLQIHCATCQEVLDGVLLAYRMAEAPEVRLPAIVNLDGFYLSFTREPVERPEPAAVREFLPAFEPRSLRFHAGEPISHGVAVLGGGPYSYFRYEQHLATLAALDAYRLAADDFAAAFGRSYDAVESYRADDADLVFFMMGSFATKAKAAVDHLRAAGRRVGAVRLRLFRPFPAEKIRQALEGRRAVIVIDQNLSPGVGGTLFGEVTTALHFKDAPLVTSVIGGLGGRDIAVEEFVGMVDEAERAIASATVPPPRLLYTRQELREVRKLQVIANVERDTVRQADE